MSSNQDDKLWAKVKADFVAGLGVYEISKKHGVSIADILKRAKAEGWQPRKTAEIVNLPVVARPAPKTEAEEVDARVEQAAQDIIRGHRTRTRELVESYELLKAEFHAMLANLASFLDETELAKLKREEKRDEAVKLMTTMLKAMGVKFTMFERLMSMHAMLVEVERTVWGLKQTDDAPGTVQWDDLLAKLDQPRRSRVLPDHITKYELIS